MMQRITITIDDELVAALDRFIAESGHRNRSEAIRELSRTGIAQAQEQSATESQAWRHSSTSMIIRNGSCPSA